MALPVPQTRFELYLANIAGESYELPAPNSRATLYLAKILGQDVELPEPQTRSELYLASIAGMSVQLPAAPTTREEWYLAKWAEDAGYVTITGNPVSFQAVAAKLRQLKIAFSPVQDLHGYDSPWPAGGGKNKLSLPVATYEKNGVTIKVNADGSVNISGTASINVIQSIGTFETGAADYLLNGGVKPYAGSFALVGIVGSSWYNVNSDDGRALPQNSTVDITIYVVNGTDTGNVTIYPMIRPASVTDPTFAPYENECPISGWTGVNVWQRGVNLWDGTFENGKWLSSYTTGEVSNASTAYNVTGFIPVHPNTQYYMRETGSSRNMFYDSEKNAIPLSSWSITDSAKIVTSPANAAYMRFTLTNAFLPNFALNYPATDHDYHAYDPASQLIPVVFPYGETYCSGWADPTTGDGLATWIIVSKPWSEWIAQGGDYGDFNLRAINVSDAAAGYGGQMFGKALSNETNYQEFSTNPKLHFYFATNKLIRYFLPKTFEASKNVQVAYELAEPIPFHVDPQQINSLAGTNNMWTDAAMLTVEYRKDGNVSDAEALSMLLGGRYTPATGPEDVSDSEALSIITGR